MRQWAYGFVSSCGVAAKCYAGRHGESAMISDVSVEGQLAIQAWRDATNKDEIDPDSDLANLAPPLGRLLGWLSEGKTCEQAGLRVKAILFVVRPDFLERQSLGRMSKTSKRILNDLVVDFKGTFVWQSAHQTNGNARKP